MLLVAGAPSILVITSSGRKPGRGRRATRGHRLDEEPFGQPCLFGRCRRYRDRLQPLSATEVTGQALAVDEDAEVTGLTLDPDDCVAPTMRPPTNPPRPAQTRAPPTPATGMGAADAWTRPKRPLSG